VTGKQGVKEYLNLNCDEEFELLKTIPPVKNSPSMIIVEMG